EDLKRELYTAIVEGDADRALAAARRLIDSGVGAQELVVEVLVPAMRRVGELFERGEYFIADVIACAEAFKRVFEEVVKPRLERGERRRVAVAVFGTVKGDIHDLGKNLAKVLFEVEGFEVIDLGVDVSPEQFAEAVEKYNARVVGVSALMTTTMLEQRRVVEELKKRGLRDKVIVIAGGAPVTEEWVREIGADVCGDDAFKALRRVKELLGVF
ncbi:MAG: cobalamin-dependent protein, partial [Desulfurococcaceae archaeon]|nr:cobalamin-dependent protein [Desulfurococcaceae archaeon]